MHQNNNDLPKFFVDAMLGNLAKKLRLLGYDAKYSSSIDDLKLIKESKIENRIIITKDAELVSKAQNRNVSSILISDTNEMSQMVQIKNEMNLPDFVVDVNKSRCTVCNGVLNKISKDKIEKFVPEGVLNNNEIFWTCMSCQKIYWQGSHIDNFTKFVVNLNERF